MPENVPPAEHLERLALEALHAAAPEPARRRMGLHSAAIGTARVSVAEHEPSILWNRVIGLGIGAPAERDDAGHIGEIYRRAGVGRYFLHLHPDAQPPELRDWLAREGLVRARGWMKFERDVSPPPEVDTALRVERVGPRHAADFGRIVAAGFEFGEPAAEAVAALNGRDGWHQFMSFAGDEPAGTGILFIHEGYGWLDMGATLPEYRGRRSQQAILAERIRFAAENGCHTLFTTTGEEVPGDPQRSYANILKLGFRESCLRENFAPGGS